MSNEKDYLEYLGPKHVAIIMDGNGRWAAARGLPRTHGHRKGVQAVRRTVQACLEMKIPHLTLYSFSSENWSRPEPEIRELMGLLKFFIRKDLADLHKNNVKIRIIGDNRPLEDGVSKLINEAVELTKSNDGLELTVAFSYGSRDEIVRATKRIADKVKSGEIQPEDISTDDITMHLDTAETPDPDLLIRTSGEKRLSNFLLWQCAYSEFVFQDVLWPDYDKDHLEAAIKEFRSRDRRYGGVQARSLA